MIPDNRQYGYLRFSVFENDGTPTDHGDFTVVVERGRQGITSVPVDTYEGDKYRGSIYLVRDGSPESAITDTTIYFVNDYAEGLTVYLYVYNAEGNQITYDVFTVNPNATAIRRVRKYVEVP